MIERQLAVISYKNHLLSAVFQGNELYDIIVEPAVAEQTIATGDIYLAKVKMWFRIFRRRFGSDQKQYVLSAVKERRIF